MAEVNGKDRLMLWKALEVAIGIIISMVAFVATQTYVLQKKQSEEHVEMWRAIDSKVNHDEVVGIREFEDKFQSLENRLERIEKKIDKLE